MKKFIGLVVLFVVAFVFFVVLFAPPASAAESDGWKNPFVVIIIEHVSPRWPDPPKRWFTPSQPCDCEKDRSCGK